MPDPSDLTIFRPRLATHPHQRAQDRSRIAGTLAQIASEDRLEAFAMVALTSDGTMEVLTSTGNVAHVESLLRRGVEYARSQIDVLTDRELTPPPAPEAAQ